MKKIHRQPGPSTSGPPISHAAVAPMPPSAAPDPERLVPLGALREGRGDDRQGGRGHDRGAGALDHAGREERRRRPGEPAHERRGREEQDTGHEHATAPEQVGRASSEQQQAAEGERVGAQHPRQVLLRKAEIGSDRGQRHDRDRAVEKHHEERAAKKRERPPAARIETGGRQARDRCGRFHHQPPKSFRAGSSEPSMMQAPRRRETGRPPTAQFAPRPVPIQDGSAARCGKKVTRGWWQPT